MSATGVAAFDTTIQTTHVWLNDIAEEMDWGHDPHRAYKALRVVLHAVRDRLRPAEAAGLAAQLPLLVRGIYYEGWHPGRKPKRVHGDAEFLAPVAAAFAADDRRDLPADIATAVFRVMKRHLSAGEVADVIAVLPAGVQHLWG